MSPRRSVAEARQTRSAILDRAVAIGSLEGLEGLTIGRLATDLGMSKSGVLGHFGSKETLQVAVLDRAADTFRREVWLPVSDARPGLVRLRRLCDAWVSYLERDVFPGGCFFVAVGSEFDGRGGPVRDAVARSITRWQSIVEREARLAVRAGELPAEQDPAQLAFDLQAVMMALNLALQLHRDRSALARARRAVTRLLDV